MVRRSAPSPLRIETVHNFRDIGGYPTQDGRFVRWQRVFRSGVMSRVGEADARALHELGIRTICDLRTNKERDRAPTTWHLAGAAELLARDHEMSAGALTDLARRADADTAHVHEMMLRTYRQLPYEQAEAYRTLFGCIAQGTLPLVFNCSAGKDRTGVAAALLLWILDVPRSLIVEDYLLTNDWLPRLIPMVSADPGYGSFVRDRIEVAMPLLRAEPEYLDAMFAALERRNGSVLNYFTDTLGLDAAALDAIRRELLHEH